MSADGVRKQLEKRNRIWNTTKVIKALEDYRDDMKPMTPKERGTRKKHVDECIEIVKSFLKQE